MIHPFWYFVTMAPLWLGGWGAILWAQPNETSTPPQLASDSVSHPREFLEVMRIDESQLSVFQDGRSLHEDERETLGLLLFRLPSFTAVDVERWVRPLPTSERSIDSPEFPRFEFYSVYGQVREIRSQAVLPELVLRWGFSSYYEVDIAVRTSPGESFETSPKKTFSLTISPEPSEMEPPNVEERMATLVTRELPSAWKGKPLEAFVGETVKGMGLLLKQTSDTEGEPTSVFATSRLGWYPVRPRADLNISRDQLLLSHWGVDISRLTEPQQRVEMVGVDRELFYQMLAGMRQADRASMEPVTRTEWDMERLMTRPEQAVGEFYTIAGQARRAVLIRVEDTDIRSRFGIDHYYEIEIFVPLSKPIRFVDSDDSEGKLFTDYPWVVCVPELPAEMETGENLHLPISATGCFLKLWGYETQFMRSQESGGRRRRLQLSPLLIVPQVDVAPSEPPRARSLGLILLGLFLVGLLSFGIWVWLSQRADRQFARTVLRKYRGP